jgi:hypothetical protein
MYHTIKKITAHRLIKMTVIGLMLAGIMSTPLCPAFAVSDNLETNKAKTQVEKNTQDQVSGKRKEILEDAVSALAETHKALKALDQNDKKAALADLEAAAGKLDVILARDHSLDLAPTGVNSTTTDIYAGPDEVTVAIDHTKKLLDRGEIQQARHILAHLASETVINVTNIPLAAYPDAIKAAVKKIDEGKMPEAKQILQTALNNLVVTQTIIPLPVVRTQQLLEQADKLAGKKDRTADEEKRLTELIDLAQKEIALAAALGYGSADDFETFNDQIALVKKLTEGGKSGVGFFDKIKASMLSMLKYSKAEGDQAK